MRLSSYYLYVFAATHIKRKLPPLTTPTIGPTSGISRAYIGLSLFDNQLTAIHLKKQLLPVGNAAKFYLCGVLFKKKRRRSFYTKSIHTVKKKLFTQKHRPFF